MQASFIIYILFEPLRHITPVTIQAIISLQEPWKEDIAWNEPLEKSLQNRWIKTVQGTREATELVIPLRYFTVIQFAVQDLHVSADVSTKAYRAVTYMYFSQCSYGVNFIINFLPNILSFGALYNLLEAALESH